MGPVDINTSVKFLSTERARLSGSAERKFTLPTPSFWNIRARGVALLLLTHTPRENDFLRDGWVETTIVSGIPFGGGGRFLTFSGAGRCDMVRRTPPQTIEVQDRRLGERALTEISRLGELEQNF